MQARRTNAALAHSATSQAAVLVHLVSIEPADTPFAGLFGCGNDYLLTVAEHGDGGIVSLEEARRAYPRHGQT